jgi:hypothetical protein
VRPTSLSTTNWGNPRAHPVNFSGRGLQSIPVI